MKYLRWQGAASFFVIIGLIALFFYLFAEILIKKGIETSVAWYTKAEVNVEEVELGYSPLKLQVNGFQATDAEQPTHNLVAFKEAHADIHFWEYLLGKIVIDELVVDGLSFSSKRSVEGEVYADIDVEEEVATSEDSTIDEIKNNLPDPKALLDSSNLHTIKASEALTNSYAEEAEKLKGLKDKLPTKETLANYQEQVKALSDIKIKSLADVEIVKEKYDALKAQFKADKAIVKSAKEELLTSKNRLADNVVTLKNAPNKDWKEIESKYQLENLDGADFAHMVFGDEARGYYDNITLLYETLSPLLAGSESPEKVEKESAEGRFIAFTEDNPLPGLLIHKILFSIDSDKGDFELLVTEFTYQHWLRNVPTTYKLTSTNINETGKVNLLGKLTTLEQGGFSTDGQWNLTDMQLSEVSLRDTQALSLFLKEGNLFANGEYESTHESINSTNAFALKQGRYDGNADSKIGKLVIDTLSSTEELSLNVNATGALTAPSLSISSDLDDVLKNAVTQQVDEKLTEFKADIQSGLNEKLSGALNAESDGKSELLNLESLLSDSDNALDNLLSSNVVKEQQGKLKNQLKDKVKDKLKGKLGSFF